MRAFRRLAQALSVVVSAYFALWACAPAATLRPLTLDMDQNEFGLGVTGAIEAGGPDRISCGDGYIPCDEGLNGQFWYQHRFGRWFSLGGTAAGGTATPIAIGVQTRFHLVELDRFRLGADLEGGFLWGAVAVPVSVRLVDDLWLYSGPSVGMRVFQSVRVPLGVTWGVTDTVWVHGEGAWGFDLLNTSVPLVRTDYWTASLAASIRF